MGLLLAGIDEAGYGPLLGPLCVGCAAFHVGGWTEGAPAPDLWEVLRAGVSRAPETGGNRATRPTRVVVADSKRLKLANSLKTRHPLVHLERGVLSFLRAMNLAEVPREDCSLFGALGTELSRVACYTGTPARVPVAHTPEQIAVAAASVGAALDRAGVEARVLACAAIPEEEFNATVRRTRSKGDATLIGVGKHLRTLWALPREAGEHVRVVCDRLGGRIAYGGVLSRLVAGSRVRVLEESPERSRYELVRGDGSAPEESSGREGPGGEARGRFIIQFQSEAESAHLPVALASMIAKYVRELAMARFNRYWCARMPELKPTAGYVQDARRWLKDATPVLDREARAALIRIA